MSIDPYAGYAKLPEGLYDNFEFVTPSDTDDLPVVVSRIWVSSEYNEARQPIPLYVILGIPYKPNYTIRIGTYGNEVLKWPCRITRVYATGTTAKEILALW